MRIQNSSVLEVNGFEQSAASGLYHCAFDLITQATRVDDRAALEGAVVQATGGALFEAVHFENGRILNPHLADYRVQRFSDLPKIEVEMLDRKDLASAGAGDTTLVGLGHA